MYCPTHIKILQTQFVNKTDKFLIFYCPIQAKNIFISVDNLRDYKQENGYFEFWTSSKIVLAKQIGNYTFSLVNEFICSNCNKDFDIGFKIEQGFLIKYECKECYERENNDTESSQSES